MKLLIILTLILSSFFVEAQNSFSQGKYVSDLGDIIIRNDSVISKDISYYVFYFTSREENELTTVFYESENRKQRLTVVYKEGIARHLMFDYKNYSEETFKVSFISK